MDFSERKQILKHVTEYLKSKNCNLESLLGLRASLQATLVAIDRRIHIMVKQQDVLKKKLGMDSNSNENEWLD